VARRGSGGVRFVIVPGVAVPVTVADLLDIAALQLRLHTTTASLDRPIAWVHVSELADPTPFLEGAELLLSTGLALADADSAAAYVGRLAAVGVVGLGIGTGLSMSEVRADLVAAADAAGLALLEVPRQTPFIALSRTVARELAADEYATVARTATAQQELSRAALAPGAPATLLARLARQIDGWAVLLDATGSVLHAVPESAGIRARDLRGDLDRLRSMRVPAGAALSTPDETVLLQSLGSGSRAQAFLVVGRPGPLPPEGRHLVNAAAMLLTLRSEQSRALDSGMASLRAALLRLLLAGELPAVADVVAALGERLPAEPIRVLSVLGTETQRAAAVDIVAEAAVQADSPVFSAQRADAVLLIVSDAGPLPDRLRLIAERVPGAHIGSSLPVQWSRLADAVRQSGQAAAHGRSRGRGFTDVADLGARGLSALLDADATGAFAEALLAPLRAADQAGAGDLLPSLQVWLARHGQWEPAAAQLGIHRHTLRKRIRRAAELLDRDLDDAGVRAELWLALHAPDTAAGPLR
jgi:purine catabolism regulator